MHTIIAHSTETSLLAQAIELIDEEDAGGVVSRPLEHVPHSGCPNAHKHLHELCAGCREERHSSLTRYGFRQQCLACSDSLTLCSRSTPT